MKVLITHELFMPDFAGGGEKLVYEMANHLQKRGIDIKVLTTGDPKINEFKGIQTIRLPINRYLMNFAFSSIKKYAKDVDIIQTSNYNACFPSWLAGKILKKPVVCFAFGLYGKRWVKMRGPIGGNISMVIENIQINRNYDKILFLSNYSRKWGMDIGIPKEITTVVNPGLNLEKYKPKRKQPFVLFSGRFAKQKGVFDIVKVAKLLPDIKFIMMGWGPEEKKLREIAPKNVEFSSLTFKSGRSFFDMYSKAAAFFLPSYGETFGFVLIEAMASGCPIVSTIPLGYKGFVVNPGDIKNMAKSIEYLIKNPKKAQKMGKQNIKLSKKYTWKRFTDNLIGIYKDITQRNKKV